MRFGDYEGLELELHLFGITKIIKVRAHGLVHGRRSAPENLSLMQNINFKRFQMPKTKGLN